MTLFQSVLLHTPTGVMSKRFGAPLVISSSDKRTVMTKDGGAAASAGTGSLCNRRSRKHWQMAVLRNRSAVLRRVKSEPFLNSSISLVEDGGVNNSECQPRCHYVRQMVPFNELTGEFARRCYNNSTHTLSRPHEPTHLQFKEQNVFISFDSVINTCHSCYVPVFNNSYIYFIS